MINISSRLSEAALFFKAAKVGVCVWMRRLRALVPGCIHALHYLCLSFVYAYSTATMTVSHMARDVLKSCECYNRAIRGISAGFTAVLPLASFLYHPHKGPMMKFPVTSPIFSSHLHLLPLIFPHCQNSDRRMRVICQVLCENQTQSGQITIKKLRPPLLMLDGI